MITAQAEEYLEAIYRLGGHLEPVHLSDLAEHLGLTAPSVNEMVRRLEEQGLVRYAPYKGVQLSEEGTCAALAVLRRHRLWECFLTDMLGLPWDVVHQEACRLEHAASDVVTERLAELLDRPEQCPHGRPLPPPDCRPPSLPQAVPLTTLPPQRSGRVAYILREDAELLRYLQSLGLVPGAQVVVEHLAPFDGPLTVRIGDQVQVIGHNAAQMVCVTQGEAL